MKTGNERKLDSCTIYVCPSVYAHIKIYPYRIYKYMAYKRYTHKGIPDVKGV